VELPILGKRALADRAPPFASRKEMARKVKCPQKVKLRKLTIQQVPTTHFCWAEVWVKQLHREADSAAAVEEVEEGADSAAAPGVKAVARGTRLAGEVDRAVVQGVSEVAAEADLEAEVEDLAVALAAGHAIAQP